MKIAGEGLRQRDFWRALAPSFHIADAAYLAPEAVEIGARAHAAAARGIGEEGYIQIAGLDLAADCAAMAALARKLTACGLDAVFSFVYDEFWRPYFRLDALFRHLIGPYTFLPDFWAWDVDPRRGGAGWEVHRDRGRLALNPDGTPISLTCWIALSEATVENGCLNMVPKHLDPDYATVREDHKRFDPASVRALPAAPGDVLVWDQAVLHWGGKAEPHAPGSRVSMSFEVQSLSVPSAEAPLIAPWQIVPFEERLRLIAAKILHYRHISRIDPAMQELAQGLLG